MTDMEDLELFLQLLQQCAAQLNRLESLLQEDRESNKRGLSGEVEKLYQERCGQAADKLKEIRNRLTVLISESSAGLI